MFDEATNQISLKDALSFIVDNRGRTAPTVKSGRILIATNCISNANLYPTYKNLRYVSQDTYDEWFRAHPEPFDIILTNKGSQNGAICLVPEVVDFCIAQDMMALRADKTKIDPLYLFAALRSQPVQSAIKNLNVDSVIPHFKKNDFDKLFLPLPNRTDQEQIGGLHFALCSKIELNRRTNEVLEGMARAVFRDWFVDFGPTRRKMAGEGNPVKILGGAIRPPAQAQKTAALFPDRLGENGLPEGWAEKPLKDTGDIVTGKTPSKKNETFYGTDTPFLKIPDMHGKMYVLATTDNLSLAGSQSQPRKQMPAGSISVSCIATPGLVVINHREVQTNQQINTIVPYDMTQTYFIYWVCKQISSDIIVGGSGGSVFHNMNKTTFGNIQVTGPLFNLEREFSEVVSSFHKKIFQNEEENQTLAEMRDLLLPKLMSGEIRLREGG